MSQLNGLVFKQNINVFTDEMKNKMFSDIPGTLIYEEKIGTDLINPVYVVALIQGLKLKKWPASALSAMCCDLNA